MFEYNQCDVELSTITVIGQILIGFPSKMLKMQFFLVTLIGEQGIPLIDLPAQWSQSPKFFQHGWQCLLVWPLVFVVAWAKSELFMLLLLSLCQWKIPKKNSHELRRLLLRSSAAPHASPSTRSSSSLSAPQRQKVGVEVTWCVSCCCSCPLIRLGFFLFSFLVFNIFSFYKNSTDEEIFAHTHTHHAHTCIVAFANFLRLFRLAFFVCWFAYCLRLPSRSPPLLYFQRQQFVSLVRGSLFSLKPDFLTLSSGALSSPYPPPTHALNVSMVQGGRMNNQRRINSELFTLKSFSIVELCFRQTFFGGQNCMTCRQNQ